MNQLLKIKKREGKGGRVDSHKWRIWGPEYSKVMREIERVENVIMTYHCVMFGICRRPPLPFFFFLEETMTATIFLDMAQMYLLLQLKDHQANRGVPASWCTTKMRVISENFFTCISLGAGLDAMDQLGDSCTQRILRRLFLPLGTH